MIWSGDPFSAYAHAERVFIDGAQVFDRADTARRPRSDFQLGLTFRPLPLRVRPLRRPGPHRLLPAAASAVAAPRRPRPVPATGEAIAITNARIQPVSGAGDRARDHRASAAGGSPPSAPTSPCRRARA